MLEINPKTKYNYYSKITIEYGNTFILIFRSVSTRSWSFILIFYNNNK